MSEEFNKKLKTILESTDLKTDLLDSEINVDSKNCFNHCCSSSSFVFVYLEDKSAFLAININKITKSSESVKDSFQYLTLTASPIGQVKKVLIDPSGTHILLVYDKSLSVVILPIKWGKYDEYEGGNRKIICKTKQFHFKHLNNIIDALWHSLPDDDYIVCLTQILNTQIIQFFSIVNSNMPVKSFNLPNSSSHLLITNEFDLKRSKSNKIDVLTPQSNDNYGFISIEIGSRFEFNNRIAYPIFLLKSNGQINCVLEYENSSDFDVLGLLRLEPYCMDYDDENQVVSFLCIGNQPNCIVLLFKNGQIYNCLFMPSTSGITGSTTFELAANYYDNLNGSESNCESALFVYEIIDVNCEDIDSNTVLTKDLADPFRYFIYHKAGVHSVFIPWLEEAKLSLNNLERFDADDYNESKLSEISNLICTKPIKNDNNLQSIAGLTLINGYGSRTMLLALTNELKFVCTFIYKSEQYDCSLNSGALNESSRNNNNTKNGHEIDSDRFINYIKSILKRDLTIPVIKSDSNASTQKDNDEFISKVINSLKSEYLEKQKLAFNQIYQKTKQLKEQSRGQEEKIKEITSSIDKMNKVKSGLMEKYKILNDKQSILTNRYEELSSQLQTQMSVLTESERNMKSELNQMKPTLKSFENKINQTKTALVSNLKDLELERDKSQEYSKDELKQIKELINDENEKLKELLEKVDKLRIAVKN